MKAAKTKHGPPNSDSWCTPIELARLLGRFDLDPASNIRSHIDSAQDYCIDGANRGIAEDGLALPWTGSVFCNPGYSDVMPWAKRLAAHDGPWCALVKLDPTTKWWAQLMTAHPTVAPFRKRIKFDSGGAGDMTANFPSVLVYSGWRPPAALRPHLWLPTFAVTAA